MAIPTPMPSRLPLTKPHASSPLPLLNQANQTDDCSSTRNHTTTFHELRAHLHTASKQHTSLLVNRKHKLAYDLLAQEEEETVLSRSSRALVAPSWGRSMELPDGDIASCYLCGVELSRYKSKYTCPLCDRLVCGTCSMKLTLEQVVASVSPRVVNICTKCGGILDGATEHAKFRSAEAQARQSTFTKAYTLLSQALGVIRTQLPVFEELLVLRSDQAIQRAGEIETTLLESFKRLDAAVKLVSRIQLASDKEVRLQQNVRQMTVAYLQDNLAVFRSLQRTRLSLQQELESNRLQSVITEAKDATQPTIIGVEPILAFLEGGTRVTITGSNFDRDVQVFIEDKSAPITHYSRDQVRVITPMQVTEGAKTIQVVNPALGTSSSLSGVLWYTGVVFAS
eukprot:TRINITY_DN7811_c0_g1_i2.p1 TRINITY_DN7811_c0_g1~~TRINITY_DN7811_c0_g1_i2.p1  ORF type:complete len:431 (-),score=34.39 TRINITY_DN7811_c0_g1_i2:91-1278(-)